MASPPFQFRLRSILALTALVALLCALVVHYGISLVLIVGSVAMIGLVAITLWSLVYRVAPEPTKYFTIFAVIGTTCLLLLPMWVVRQREQFRQIEFRHRLRQLGGELAESKEFHPPPQPTEYGPKD